MLSEDVALKGLDAVDEDDGVVNLHYDGQGHHLLLLITILDLLLKKLLEGGSLHPGGVDDLSSLELQPLLEDLDGTVLASEGEVDGDTPGCGCYEVLLAREKVLRSNCPLLK